MNVNCSCWKKRSNHFNRNYDKKAECDREGKFKHYVEYPETRDLFFEMVRRIVEKYRSDKRILVWNVESKSGITEWLNRCNHNTVQEIYPFLMYDKIGSYCWGFVGGMTYTTEPWDDFWKKYKENPDIDFDFTKWQHDLIRRDYHPYDPREIKLIRRCNERADKK